MGLTDSMFETVALKATVPISYILCLRQGFTIFKEIGYAYYSKYMMI